MIRNMSKKNFLSSIITAIDMYNELLRDHHRRTSVLAYQLGKAYGLDDQSLDHLVLAAALHDIGTLSVTERDQLLVVDVLDPKPHEELGAKMLSLFPPFRKLSEIIAHHHIRYEEVLASPELAKEVHFECFFLHLADCIDVLMIQDEYNGDRSYVEREIEKRFGTVFHPKLQEVFGQLMKQDVFWENRESVSYYELLYQSMDDSYFAVEEQTLEELAKIFARIVDYKSHWTCMHSQTVSLLSEKIDEYCGLGESTCAQLRIAGALHDIGKYCEMGIESS